MQALSLTTRRTADALLDASRLPFAALAAASAVLAARPGRAQDVDVLGPLQANADGLAAAQGSSFTAEGVQTGAGTAAAALLAVLGLVGLALVGIGLYQMFKHSREGDRSQGSNMAGIVMVGIGGFMTITAVIAGIAPALFLAG